jgi:hypothetical protein
LSPFFARFDPRPARPLDPPCDNGRVPRFFPRRVGPLGLALTAFDLWRRLPPSQRRRIVEATRTHGPRLAAKAREQGRRRRRPPTP